MSISTYVDILNVRKLSNLFISKNFDQYKFWIILYVVSFNCKRKFSFSLFLWFCGLNCKIFLRKCSELYYSKWFMNHDLFNVYCNSVFAVTSFCKLFCLQLSLHLTTLEPHYNAAFLVYSGKGSSSNSVALFTNVYTIAHPGICLNTAYRSPRSLVVHTWDLQHLVICLYQPPPPRQSALVDSSMLVKQHGTVFLLVWRTLT